MVAYSQKFKTERLSTDFVVTKNLNRSLSMLNIKKIRQDFPILNRQVNRKQLVYFDNAATSQKPRQVIEAVSDYYKKYNANIHRGIHTLSLEATEKFEQVREKVAKFVGVKDASEIIFTKNATEAINLVAYSWGRLNISENDEIVLSVAEHHSNFVPWQQLAAENGAILKIVPINQDGELNLDALKSALTKKTKLVTLFHVSNVLGTINPIKKIVSSINNYVPRPLILVDGAQAVPHMPVNIGDLGCDFYVFTGHKMLAPTGLGVLWGRRELLENLPPFLFGGEMISKVDWHNSTWNEIPLKFEAGTPDISAVIGLGTAIDYLSKVGMENVRKHEISLTEYILKQLAKLPFLSIYGPQFVVKRSGVISFNLKTADGKIIHAHDVAQILDSQGIAVRSGHHCAQPLMKFLGIQSAVRVSFYLYNTKEEVDKLTDGLKKVAKIFTKRQNIKRPRVLYGAGATI